MRTTDFLSPDQWLNTGTGPRYAKLQRRLEDGISSGIFPENSSLPPERELAEVTGLSRVTVRKAIQSMVEKGAVIQRQGSGSFVSQQSKKLVQSLTTLSSFSDDMRSRGMNTTSMWLERGMFLPSEQETDILGLSTGHSVSRLHRLRLADDKPCAIERASLPTDILPNPTEIQTSLYQSLAERGIFLRRAVQKFSAQNLSPFDAELLGLEPGTAALRILRISYLQNGRAVELTHSIYRGDTYEFVAELELTPEQP